MLSTLSYRPIVPGSAAHLALLERAGTPKERLGWVLYPDLMHRRACAAIAAAAAKVTKQEAARMDVQTASVPIPVPALTGDEDGCSTKCA